jgi:hypothetical protein
MMGVYWFHETSQRWRRSSLASLRNMSLPGLLLVPSRRSIGAVIDGLLLVWVTWTPEDLRNQARWLPWGALDSAGSKSKERHHP